MQENEKQYQLWRYDGYGLYTLTEYDTLEECLQAPKYSMDYYITKKVSIKVTEEEI